MVEQRSYHAAEPVTQGPSVSGYSNARPYYGRPRRHASFGYSTYYAPGYYVAPAPAVMVAEPVEQAGAESTVRVTVGVEGQGYLNGATLGVLGTFEGERWGVSLSASSLLLKADDGSQGVDVIGDFTAHLTFAFLTGQYGRLRAELGADAFFAPDVIMVGPTGGLSGVVWLGGPLGIEGSVMVTPWPYTQIDARAGLALGLGQFGIRAGWRVQALNDRGVVDGVAHTDLLNGPYVGLSFVF